MLASASYRGAASMPRRPIVHALLLSTLFAGAASAQRSTVLNLKDVTPLLESRGHDVSGTVTPLQRLARLVSAWFLNGTPAEPAPEPPAKPPARRTRIPTLGLLEDQGMILVSGQQEHVDLVESVVKELRSDVVRELRLQCTLVRLPLFTATAHGLAIGRATPVDEVAASKLLKEAVQAKGRLQNLPEVKIAPFVPFRIEPPAGDRKPEATKESLRLRGEALLVRDDEALFAVQLVDGALPDDRTVLPKSPLADGSFRLESGAGVILLSTPMVGSTNAPEVVAVWLRLMEIARAEPNVTQPDATKPKQDDGK